jgi:sulfite dehydrogenase (cytochrome) subunit B
VRGALAGATLLAALALVGALAFADEDSIQLRDGNGRDLTAARCAMCHSVDYIQGNAPVLDRAGWKKEIQKMRDRFAAPISDEEAQQILDYLAGSYAGKP